MKRPETKGFSSSSNMLVAEWSYKKHVPWIPVPKNPRKNSHPTLPFHRFEKTNPPFRGWLLGPYPSNGWWFWMYGAQGVVRMKWSCCFDFSPQEKPSKRMILRKFQIPAAVFFFSCVCVFFSCFAYINFWNLTTTWCCGWYLCFQCLGLEADTLVLETCDAARWSISALWTWPWRYFKVS